MAELGYRFTGSSDLYQDDGRHAFASINFIAAHDGFTLHDLVSYEHKHNEANGEENRDGVNESFSRNWGAEGPTTSAPVLRMRERMRKNLIATLAFSQGVPMLSHGDEMGRTQRGNNNAYCQDNEVSWINWDLSPENRELLEFTREVLAIMQKNPVFLRRRFFQGGPAGDGGLKDVSWLRPAGGEMTLEDWGDPRNMCVGMLIDGEASDDVDERGRPNRGETLFLLLNAGSRSQDYALPHLAERGQWHEAVNTALPAGRSHRRVPRTGVHVAPHSLVLLRYELD